MCNQWALSDDLADIFFFFLLSTDFTLLRFSRLFPTPLTASLKKKKLNNIFFQALYCYSVSAIKVRSWPFSFTLWLWPFVKLEHFQSKLILRVPKDVILIYSLSPLNGTGCPWQRFSGPTFKEHTVFSLPEAFQKAAQGLSKGSNGCQSLSTLHFIHGCQRTWWVQK